MDATLHDYFGSFLFFLNLQVLLLDLEVNILQQFLIGASLSEQINFDVKKPIYEESFCITTLARYLSSIPYLYFFT